MSDLNTLLFTVGIAVFMITVYGVVLAGGFALQRKQRDELASDVEIITNDHGYEVMTSTKSSRTDHSDH